MTPLLAESLPSLAGPEVIQKPYELTKTGVVFNRSLSDDEYDGLIRRIAVVANATPWQIGDWLVAGTGRFDEAGVTYQRVHELTGRSYDTIKQYLHVSLSFSHEERGIVPWTFYRASLRLPAGERGHSLAVARSNGWTSSEFVEFIGRRLSGEAVDGLINPAVGGLITPGGGARRGETRKVTCPFCQRTFESKGRAAKR